MVQLFPPERVSERMVYKSSTSQCLKFLLESTSSRTLKPVTPSLAFLTFLRSWGCRDNVEKSMCQACGAQNWTKFAIHQVSERHSGVLKSFPLRGGRLHKPTAGLVSRLTSCTARHTLSGLVE